MTLLTHLCSTVSPGQPFLFSFYVRGLNARPNCFFCSILTLSPTTYAPLSADNRVDITANVQQTSIK